MKRPVYRSHFDRLWKIKNFTSYLVTHHSSIHLYVHHLYSRHCFKQTKPKKTNKLTSQKILQNLYKMWNIALFKKQPYNLFIPEFLIFGVNRLFLFMKWWSYFNHLSIFPFFSNKCYNFYWENLSVIWNYLRWIMQQFTKFEMFTIFYKFISDGTPVICWPFGIYFLFHFPVKASCWNI